MLHTVDVIGRRSTKPSRYHSLAVIAASCVIMSGPMAAASSIPMKDCSRSHPSAEMEESGPVTDELPRSLVEDFYVQDARGDEVLARLQTHLVLAEGCTPKNQKRPWCFFASMRTLTAGEFVVTISQPIWA